MWDRTGFGYVGFDKRLNNPLLYLFSLQHSLLSCEKLPVVESTMLCTSGSFSLR